MRNNFLKRIACFGIIAVMGMLVNNKVKAEPVLLWMELESKVPISSSDDLTECSITDGTSRETAKLGRSVKTFKNVQFKGAKFYLNRETYLGDIHKSDMLMEDSDLDDDVYDYSLIEYYLTKVAYKCDRAEAQRRMLPNNSFEGNIMKPVGVEIGGKSIKAYLNFGNRTITAPDKVIEAQGVKPLEPIPSFDAEHLGRDFWKFRLVQGSDVIKPIPQAPLNEVWADRPFMHF